MFFCTFHFHFFSQVGISAFDPSLPGVQNRTEDCILETIGKPVFKRFSFQSISIYSFPSRCLNGFLWISSTFQIFLPLSVWIFLQVHSRWARRMACWSTGCFKIRLIWDWVDLWLDWLNSIEYHHQPRYTLNSNIKIFLNIKISSNITSREIPKTGTRSGQRGEARGNRIFSMSLLMKTSIGRWAVFLVNDVFIFFVSAGESPASGEYRKINFPCSSLILRGNV